MLIRFESEKKIPNLQWHFKDRIYTSSSHLAGDLPSSWAKKYIYSKKKCENDTCFYNATTAVSTTQKASLGDADFSVDNN